MKKEKQGKRRTALLLTVLAAVIFIVATDAGNSLNHKNGAGDIWWTQVESIETAYQRANGRSFND